MQTMAEGESGSFDLIQLSGPLTVEAILKSLQQRFMEGNCYSWIGPILLCTNAYEPPSTAMHAVLKKLVFMLMSDLSDSERPRTLVLSGVSGSGKTFTANQLLAKMFHFAHKTDWLQDLRRYWQVSSVVLKALGTASIESNKDSSRIGRMVDFYFKGLQITKVKINCYFLDQTRLVSPTPSEQNYHIFYQLLAGLSPEERGKYFVSYHDLRTLHYLSQGTEPRESPQQLQSHFEAWKSSLAQLGIPLNDVLKVLVATLLLGNVLFYEAKNQELSMQGAEDLRAVASLLGVQPLLLQKGLTLRTYRSGRGPAVHSPCSAAAANGARDALAKSLYIRTVVAIMRRINTLLRGASQRGQPGMLTPAHPQGTSERSIHFIDLFGFEANEVNSLEHLCVNLAAERVQHYYSQALFANTMQECSEEGVDPLFESSLYDCSPCIDLIGGQHNGLVQLLNKETLSPRVSSEDIRVRLRDKFQSNRCFIPPVGSSSTFAIRHYCGDVVYDIYSLLNANADTVADDIVATFNSKDCKFGFVAHLFAVELNRDLHDGIPHGQMCRITPAYLQHAAHSDSRQPTTYVQDFQSNLTDVFSVLKKSKPYFVRCLKSNSSQTPGHFDREVVGQQIQHMAVFETVDFIQTGFTHWLPYDQFVQRYRVIAPDSLTRLRSRAREMAEDLMLGLAKMVEDCDVSEESYAFGKTKIFLNEEFRQSLERLRDRILRRAAVKIQANVRTYLCRKHWPQLKFSLRQARLQGEAQTQLSEDAVQTPHAQNGEKAYTVRNYTIVGNYKVGFPQWRVMKCQYPDSGHTLLRAGDEVYVLGRSQKRGYLIVEHTGQQIHMPHHYTELRLTPPNSPPPVPPPVPPKRHQPQLQPQPCSDL